MSPGWDVTNLRPYFFITIGFLFPWDPQKTGYKLTAPTHTYLDIFSAYYFICTLVGSLIVISENKSRSLVSNSFRSHGLYSQQNSPDQNTWVDSLSPVQGIFPTQGSNPGLPHCRQILYQLSHKGSSRILEWVGYPFSRGSSWPRSWTGVYCIAGRFFTNWNIREVKVIVISFTLTDSNMKISLFPLSSIHWYTHIDTCEIDLNRGLEKEMATHSSVLALRIPGIGKPGWAAVCGVAQSRTRLKRLSSRSRGLVLSWRMFWSRKW